MSTIAALALLVLCAYQLWIKLPQNFSPLLRACSIVPLLSVLTFLVALVGVPTQVSLPAYLILSFLCAMLWFVPSSDLPRAKWSRIDVAVLCVFLGGCAMYLPSFLSFNSGLYLPIPSHGEDAISHLSIYLLILKEQGLLFFRDHLTSIEVSGLLHYPQAFHFSTAFLFEIVSGFLPTRSIPIAINLFVLSVIAWGASIAALLLYGGVSIRKHCSWLALGTVATLVMILVAGWLAVYLTFFSFYSQIAALVFFALVLTLLTSGTRRSILWAVIADIGVTTSWYFLTPVTTGVLFVATFCHFRLFSKREWVLIWMVSLFAKCFLIWISLAGMDTHNALIQPGGIMLPPSWIFWGIGSVGALTSIGALLKNDKLPLILIAALVIATLFSAALYGYQIYAAGGASYYFYKSLYSVIVPATMLSVYGICGAVDSLQEWMRSRTKYSTYLVATGLAVLLGFCISASLFHYRGYLSDKLHFIKPSLYKELIRLSNLPTIEETRIFFFTDDHVEAYLQNRLIPKITGSKVDIERQDMPLHVLRTGEPYAAWLYRHISEEDRAQPVIILDLKKRLRNRCAKEYFLLNKAGTIRIVPKEAGVWRIDKCGELEP